MRARNLKPDFFKNDVLGTMPMAARLLFEGLWCMADREGRLEDRPLRIKIEVLPYDDVDVDDLLNQLAANEFIARYESTGIRCIQVINFGKHQNPHIKEAPSTLPAPDKHGASTVQAPEIHEASPADSPSPRTDSGLLTEESKGNVSSSDADAPTEGIGPVFGDDTPEYELAVHLADRKLENNPKSKPTSERQLQNWANDVRLMVQRDERSFWDIRALIDWSQSDDFWRANILSMGKLREKYDQLWLKMTTPIPARASPAGFTKNGVRNGIGLMHELEQEQAERERHRSQETDRSYRGDVPGLTSG